MEGVRAVGAQMLGTRGRVVPPGFDRHLLSTLLLAAAKPTQSAAMNGTEPQIEIFKPFGEAFELMKKILFQPFDLKKWLVIGFAAFLASLSGGFNFSFNSFSRWNSQRDHKAISESFRELPSVGQMEWWVIGLFVVGGLIILAFILALMWLGARG